MPDFLDRRDLDFHLYEMHALEGLAAQPRYGAHDRAVFDGILDTAVTLAEERFWPHAAKSDANEPHFDGERVHIIPEVAEALAAYRDAGFFAAPFDEAHGGLQLPQLLNSAIGMVFSAANVGTAGYPFLTQAAANLLAAHGTAEQQRRWMQPMVEGRFFGTMCLSEPQAGSSLADIRTRAVPQPDGSYHLVGNKMWISGGEHDLSENIVHLVLARIEGAPAGTKGISLFIVPRRHLAEDGSCGERNGVRLMGLNHKMGYRGTVNTVLSFGDDVPCVGELIGEPHQGLRYMFHMMNEARIGVGLGACALGVAGYRVSLAYARERPQGRPIANKDPEAPQVPIIDHADVRRMLLAQKAWVEGGLSLCLYCARLVDDQYCSEDLEARKAIDALLGLLTPIAKAWPSEWCLEANKFAIQILGGYGYTRDYPVERFYRDNRLNPIHEGTNGIQAIDLLGRKVFGDGGRTLGVLATRIEDSCRQAAEVEALREYAEALRDAVQRLGATSARLGELAAGKGPETALANAAAYLDMAGHTVVAWRWLEQARVATAAMDGSTEADKAFYRGKLAACRYFFLYELPKVRVAEALLSRGDRMLLELDPTGL